MSPQQQAGILRSLVVKKLKQARVRETMADTLKRTRTISTGRLLSTVLSKDVTKLVKLNYSIDKESGLIYNVIVRYNRGLNGWDGGDTDPEYALAVDSVYGAGPIPMRPPRSKITQWIYRKLKNGTWDGPPYYRVTRKTKYGSKTYTYPLTDGRYRKKLAYLIQRSIINRQELAVRSPYITAGDLQVEFAILAAIEEFALVYEDNIANRVETVLESIF